MVIAIEPGTRVKCINIAPRTPAAMAPHGLVLYNVYTVKEVFFTNDFVDAIWAVRLEETRNFNPLWAVMFPNDPIDEDAGYWIERFVPIRDISNSVIESLKNNIDTSIKTPELV